MVNEYNNTESKMERKVEQVKASENRSGLREEDEIRKRLYELSERSYSQG